MPHWGTPVFYIFARCDEPQFTKSGYGPLWLDDAHARLYGWGQNPDVGDRVLVERGDRLVICDVVGYDHDFKCPPFVWGYLLRFAPEMTAARADYIEWVGRRRVAYPSGVAGKHKPKKVTHG